MEHYKPNGNDINSWSYQELVIMVSDFQKLIESGQNPLTMYGQAQPAYDSYSYDQSHSYVDPNQQNYNYGYD